MGDAKAKDKPTTYSEYLKIRLDLAEEVTGEERAKIIERWLSYFAGYKELLEKIGTIRHLSDIEDELQYLEENVDFELIWMTQYVNLVGKLRKFLYEIEGTLFSIRDLQHMKSLRDKMRALPSVFTDYNEREMQSEIQEKSPYGQAHTLFGELALQRAESAIKLLKKDLRHYRKLKSKLWLSRFGLRLFWGLIVLTLLIGWVVELLHPVVSVILSIVLWFIEECLVQPWLEKKVETKQRKDMQVQVFVLYKSYVDAKIEMELAQKDLDDFDESLKQLIEHQNNP